MCAFAVRIARKMVCEMTQMCASLVATFLYLYTIHLLSRSAAAEIFTARHFGLVWPQPAQTTRSSFFLRQKSLTHLPPPKICVCVYVPWVRVYWRAHAFAATFASLGEINYSRLCENMGTLEYGGLTGERVHYCTARRESAPARRHIIEALQLWPLRIRTHNTHVRLCVLSGFAPEHVRNSRVR